MDWSMMRRLDPAILLGIVNEKLRLECSDLEEFSATYEMDVQQLHSQLAAIGYRYDALTNQFRLH